MQDLNVELDSSINFLDRIPIDFYLNIIDEYRYNAIRTYSHYFLENEKLLRLPLCSLNKLHNISCKSDYKLNIENINSYDISRNGIYLCDSIYDEFNKISKYSLDKNFILVKDSEFMGGLIVYLKYNGVRDEEISYISKKSELKNISFYDTRFCIVVQDFKYKSKSKINNERLELVKNVIKFNNYDQLLAFGCMDYRFRTYSEIINSYKNMSRFGFTSKSNDNKLYVCDYLGEIVL